MVHLQTLNKRYYFYRRNADEIRIQILKEFYKGALTISQKMVYSVKGKMK